MLDIVCKGVEAPLLHKTYRKIVLAYGTISQFHMLYYIAPPPPTLSLSLSLLSLFLFFFVLQGFAGIFVDIGQSNMHEKIQRNVQHKARKKEQKVQITPFL